MAKGDNFGGGLTKGVIDKIAGLTTGSNPPVTGAAAANLLLAVAREEHQALFPGPGQAGIFDVLNAIGTVETAIVDVTTNPTPPNIAKLQKAVDEVGNLWKKGPVDSSFYSTP
jgi:hypothetical protein